MTSRMAFNYPTLFKSLTLMAGSYAWCLGLVCGGPGADAEPGLAVHPPTLFLHGLTDLIVPSSTSLVYYNELRGRGIPTRRETNTFDSHEWLGQSPQEVLSWVQLHN